MPNCLRFMIPSVLSVTFFANTLLPAMGQETPATPAPATPTAPAAPTATGPAADPLTGPIRKGDILSVQVYGEPQLSRELRVDADGTINMPLIGTLNVLGLSPREASSRVARALVRGRFLRNPQVSLAITGRAVYSVFISGAVANQGRQTIRERTRLNEVLEASGLTANADLRRVQLTRGANDIVVDYLTFRSGKSTDPAYNPRLQDDDKIFVYSQVTPEGTLQVQGEVKSPQTLTLTGGMTAAQAIQQAGGLTDISDKDNVIVRRAGAEIKVPIQEIQEGNASRDIALQDKDTIFVARLNRAEAVTVTGAVVAPDKYPLQSRMTLLDAIAAARGTADGAKQDRVVLRRTNAQGVVEDKVFNINSPQGASVALQAGDIIDVPRGKPSSFNLWNVINTATSVLYLLRR